MDGYEELTLSTDFSTICDRKTQGPQESFKHHQRANVKTMFADNFKFYCNLNGCNTRRNDSRVNYMLDSYGFEVKINEKSGLKSNLMKSLIPK